MTDTQVNTQTAPGFHHPLATWMNLRRDYTTGKGTVAQLARKYGILETTVWNKVKAEKWGRLRAKYFARQVASLEQMTETPPEPETKPEQKHGTVAVNGEGKVREQIEAIDKLFDQATDAADLVKLADAKAKLWSLLYPKPGVKRPPRRGYSQVPSPDPVPTPDQSQV